MMILKLKDYKDQIAILFLWFPILFAINANLTDVLYFGLSKTANINAIRIFLFFSSFFFLIIYFFFNFKKIKLSNSIFFLYLLVFIIQSNFLFSENFNQFKIDYKIFFSGNIPNIIEYIKDYNIGLEVQSVYMMIGSFSALLYYINFNNKKFHNTLKLKIIFTSYIIAIIYLYFTFNMMVDFFLNDETILLYYSDYLAYNEVFGHVMTRSTGVSRILAMISIISLLFFFNYKNIYIRTLSLFFLIVINTIIVLLASRFAIYSCTLIILLIIFLIKLPNLKKMLILICVLIIPYFTQHIIKEYKIYELIVKKTDIEKITFFQTFKSKNIKKNSTENYSYKKIKKDFIKNTNITTQRKFLKIDKEKNNIQIETTGRTEIWKRVYGLFLNDKINIWIGNGFQTDRKLLKGGKSDYYGSNISNALLNIFVCSGIFGLLIFIYINIKILIRIYQFIFIKKIYNNFNSNFGLIISINVLLFLYLRSLIENSISYYNLDFLIFLMILYIIDKESKII